MKANLLDFLEWVNQTGETSPDPAEFLAWLQRQEDEAYEHTQPSDKDAIYSLLRGTLASTQVPVSANTAIALETLHNLYTKL
jgi:hypothetical protein